MVGNIIFLGRQFRKITFELILLISILFLLIQIICLSSNIAFFGGFIYCPLLYFYKRNLNNKWFLKGRIIYVNIILYVFAISINVIYPKSISLSVLIMYLLFYTQLIDNEINKQKKISFYENSNNITIFYKYFAYLFIIIFLLDILGRKVPKVFRSDFQVIYVILSIICTIFSIIFFKTLKTKQVDIEIIDSNDIKTDFENIKNNSESELASKIFDFFESSQHYLNPNFTLTDLSEALHTNKENISEVLNNELKFGFYLIVAKYRIDHAKKLIQENERYTLEAIMERCGFHSKSTFNKYFKLFVGKQPSVYRKNLLK